MLTSLGHKKYVRGVETVSSEIKVALFCNSNLPHVFRDPRPRFGAEDGYPSAANDIDGGEVDAGPLYYDSMQHRTGPSYRI